MKCSDVQDRLWSGVHSGVIDLHIQGCEACRKEELHIRLIAEQLQNMYIPPASKNLIPDDNILLKVEKRNRAKPKIKYTSMAASFLLLVSVGTVVLINTNQTEHFAPGKQVQQPIHNIDIDAQAANPEFCKSIQQYIDSNTHWEQVRHITIVDFNPTNKSDATLEGVVSLQVDLIQDATSEYMNGYQNKYVTFSNQNGQWKVETIRPTHEINSVTEIMPTAKHAEFAEAVRLYIQNNMDLSGVADLIVVDVELPDIRTDMDNVDGIVTIKVAVRPNQRSIFNAGINTKTAHFKKMQGLWVVDSLK